MRAREETTRTLLRGKLRDVDGELVDLRREMGERCVSECSVKQGENKLVPTASVEYVNSASTWTQLKPIHPLPV